MIPAPVRALAWVAAAAAVLLPPTLDDAPAVAAAHLGRCFEPAAPGAPGPGAPGPGATDPGAGARSTSRRSRDHRVITPAQQRRIESRTRRLLGGRRTSSKAPVTIRVYVHVMESGSGAGNVSDERIARQVDVLNRTYSGADPDHPGGPDTGFRFRLAGVDRFRNNAWHADGDSETYRARTRRGSRAALNVWLVDFDYLGVATFPWDDSSAGDLDGLRIQYTSLPGGSAAHYDEGKTLTHETGHWLGLYHTFQDGCSAPGDEVDDTPAQASPSSGCPTGRDSCSGRGRDPIHDYMDYSYDSCYRFFTPGQVARMKQFWTAYRG